MGYVPRQPRTHFDATTPSRFYSVSALAAGDMNQYIEAPTTDYGHDGWAFDAQGNEVFVYQDNNSDWITAFNPATGEVIKIMNLKETGWGLNQHMARISNPYLSQIEHGLGQMRGDWATSLYDAIFMASQRLGAKDGRRVLVLVSDGDDTASSATYTEAVEQALRNVTPVVEVKPRRVGGATYQVPVDIRTERRGALAMRWLIGAARSRKGKSMAEKLAAELSDAAAGQGGSVKKREDTHRMAEANRAFVHYRW